VSEFSVRSQLEVQVDSRSLSDARDTIESELGSVRATVEPGRGASTSAPGGVAALSDGGSGVRDLLEQQTEHLEEIREALEDIRNDGAGGSGGLGGGAGAAIGRTLGSVGMTTAALAAGGIGLGVATDQAAREQLPDGVRSTLQQSRNFRETPIGTQLVNPVEFAQTAGEVFVAEARSRLATVSISEPDWIGRLTGLDLSAPEWLGRLTSVRFETPSWLSRLTGFTLDTPPWLADLRTLQLPTPQWVQELQSIVSGIGGGGGGGGGGPSTTADNNGRPESFPGSDQGLFNEAARRRDRGRTQVNNDITVEAIINDLGNAQRIIEQSVTQRLRNEVID